MRRSNTNTEISTISLAEIAIKHVRGQLHLNKDDVLAAMADQNLGVLPWTADHAYRLFTLSPQHGDPFDRQLIAQALAEDIPIVTPDPLFRRYHGLKVIW